jgi:hypothetical protein
MQSTLIVVDDFYANPDAVRRFALESKFGSVGALNYPGWQSEKTFHSDAVRGAFEKIIRKPIDIDDRRFTWGGFRAITADTGRVTKVHADSIVDWAAMVYLTPDAASSAGTGFFRHRETGLTGPPSDRQARALGYADADAFEREVVRRDMADFDKWELVSYIEPVYNRLVLFRGCELYHAPLGGRGSSPEDARITHNFFFNEQRPRSTGVRLVGATSGAAAR